MDTALVVAGIATLTALASAAFSWQAQLAVTDRRALRDRETREAEQRSEAKRALDRYRGPLIDAAWHLGNRIDNIRHRNFLAYVSQRSSREQDAILTTLFRFSYYFGWREFVRAEVQLLRFENEDDTRLVAGFLNDVVWILSSESLDGARGMCWADEQRGIGELMSSNPPESMRPVKGYSGFRREYQEVFAPWLERLASDLLSPHAAESDRLRLLQWALYGLVRRLDEEGSYTTSEWLDRTQREILQDRSPSNPVTNVERELGHHLAALESADPGDTG